MAMWLLKALRSLVIEGTAALEAGLVAGICGFDWECGQRVCHYMVETFTITENVNHGRETDC